MMRTITPYFTLAGRISMPILVIVATVPAVSSASVVINEIFYHSPGDLDDLEYVELFNSGAGTVDLAGWKFTAGIEYVFPAGATIPPQGYLVLCKQKELLNEFYGIEPFGLFSGSLSNGGETLTLVDGRGRNVETVSYRDRSPWPLSADGYSASIERICPTKGPDSWSNWAPSTLSDDYASKPSGTPGKKNSRFAPSLPPVIASVSVSPKLPKPGEALRIEARVEGGGEATVELLYRIVRPGSAGEEVAVPMVKGEPGRWTAPVPGQEAQRIIRLRVKATGTTGSVRFYPEENEIRPALSVYVSGPMEVGKVPVVHFFNVGEEEYRRAAAYRENQERGRRGPGFGGFRRPGPFGPSAPGTPLRPQGRSAFIYIDPESGKPELFDFVNIVERKGGFKVRLHGDRPLKEMRTINVIYEADERSILNEHLAYELYRLAGNSTILSGYLRVLMDGQFVGYHLFFEQPNRSFLRRNGIDDGGNLYKVLWYGSNRASPRTPADRKTERQDIVGRYEKKTHPHDGYKDLVDLIEALETTKGDDALWEVIRKRFDVDQVVNYFAVNMLISHWDGFFNNYFLYHDTGGTGKWTLYPWDQDSTWSHRMSSGNEVYYQMVLTFGMEGDVPPGADSNPAGDDRRGGPGGFGRGRGGAWWWRPGGDISRPLLANLQFRRRFLSRLGDLAETVYTESVFAPRFARLRELLEGEVRLRAEASGQDPDGAVRRFSDSLAFFQEHLVKRRQFLLGQEELRNGPTLEALVRLRSLAGGRQGGFPGPWNGLPPLRPGPAPRPGGFGRLPEGNREPADELERGERQEARAALERLLARSVIVIPAGSRWKYLDTGASPGPGWTTLDFKDDAWSEGPAQLGYGDGDEATRLNDARDNYPTYYFRKTFEVQDPGRLKPLVLRLIRDDGAVVYINGREVWRDNMPAGSVDHETLAADTAFAENEYYLHDIAPGQLVAGRNIIAVEVHQASAESSDVSFDLELREKIPAIDQEPLRQ